MLKKLTLEDVAVLREPLVLGRQSPNALGGALLCFVVFYTMIFVLPEQLVILYCKFRFKSFNYNERGNLYNEG